MIHNLRIVAWNANSVSTKKADLDLFLHVNKIDTVAISETKLSPNCRFTIPGYTGLFISPSGISELDCSTTKTDTAERSISIGRESLQVFLY